jgi:hypothetical protein
LGLMTATLLWAYPAVEERYGFRIRKQLHSDGSSYHTYFLIGSAAFLTYTHKALQCLELQVDDLSQRKRHLDDLKSHTVEPSDSELRGESSPSVCTIANESVAVEEAIKKLSIEHSDAVAFKDGWSDMEYDVRQAGK